MHTIIPRPVIRLLVNSITEGAHLAPVHDDDDDDPRTKEIRLVLPAVFILMLLTPFLSCLLIPINIFFSDSTPFFQNRLLCYVRRIMGGNITKDQEMFFNLVFVVPLIVVSVGIFLSPWVLLTLIFDRLFCIIL